MSKPLQHCHALVALVFDDDAARSSLVATLAGWTSVDSTLIESFTHDDGRPAAVIHVRYRARGANMNDIPRRLEAAAKSADVTYEVLHEPRGFSVKRPELEQDVPPRAATEPTDPVQVDWSQATDVQGPDAPFQGALRVPLAGPVDDEWLAALADVAAGTDALEAIVQDCILYVPAPWRGEAAMTHAGEVRQTLREAVTRHLNVVNDQFHYRVGRPAADDFLAMTEAALEFAVRKPEQLPGLIRQFVHEGERLHSASSPAGPRGALDAPPTTAVDRNAAVDEVIAEGAHWARIYGRDEGAERAALIFRSWDRDAQWVVAHVFERGGRSATWQAAPPEWPPKSDLDWQQVDDRGRFSALAAALEAEVTDPPA